MLSSWGCSGSPLVPRPGPSWQRWWPRGHLPRAAQPGPPAVLLLLVPLIPDPNSMGCGDPGVGASPGHLAAQKWLPCSRRPEGSGLGQQLLGRGTVTHFGDESLTEVTEQPG